MRTTPTKLRLSAIPALLLSAGMLSSPSVYGVAPAVVSVSPPNASRSAMVDTPATAVFDLDVSASVVPGDVVIHGSQSPVTGVSLSFAQTTTPNDTVIGDPDFPAGNLDQFFPGERVQATMRSVGGSIPAVWSFRTRVTAGPTSIVVDGDDFINGPDDLLLIAPTVELHPGFVVETDGKLTVISADPSMPPQ